jgi:hypothetical protein
MLSLADRVKQAHQDFHHPDTHLKYHRAIPGSANAVLHLKTTTGQQYVAKPYEPAIDSGHQPERWASRNAAAANALAAMGAGHMAPANFHGTIHGPDRVDSRINQRKGEQFLGRDAHIASFAHGAIHAHEVPEEMLDKVDGEHRLVGLIHHTLFGNSDGSHKNVLIDAEHGHPVLIDHDITLNSLHQAHHRYHDENNPDRFPAVKSIFAPGEDLDYSKGIHTDPITGEKKELGQVGTDFKKINPRMHSLLTWIAAGGHNASPEQGGWGLTPDDASILQGNATDLLTHGLEGTLAKRRMISLPKARNPEKRQELTRMGAVTGKAKKWAKTRKLGPSSS